MKPAWLVGQAKINKPWSPKREDSFGLLTLAPSLGSLLNDVFISLFTQYYSELTLT